MVRCEVIITNSCYALVSYFITSYPTRAYGIIVIWTALHSSVDRASHRYRGGLGFESRWSPYFFRLLLSNCLNWKIIRHDHSLLSPTTRSSNMNYFIYTSHDFTPHGRYELNKLTSLPMCGFITQLSIAPVSQVRIPLKPWILQASSFQLVKLEN